MEMGALSFSYPVHCRAGSLENIGDKLAAALKVHCRAGSLEIVYRVDLA